MAAIINYGLSLHYDKASVGSAKEESKNMTGIAASEISIKELPCSQLTFDFFYFCTAVHVGVGLFISGYTLHVLEVCLGHVLGVDQSDRPEPQTRVRFVPEAC